MNIAVIGAGVTGISTAYELANAGHSVTVFEKANAAAEGASFAPSGLIAPSLMQPCALSASDQPQWNRFINNLKPLSVRSGLHLNDLKWLWQWSRTGSESHLSTTIENLRALYDYSAQCMRSIASHANLEFEQSNGQLMVLRTPADEAIMRPTLNTLKQHGIVFHELSQEACIKIEPALSLSTDFHIGIYFPNDEIANCRQFVMLLKTEMQNKPVGFEFNSKVKAILASPQLSICLENDAQPRIFDHIVVCAGSETPELLHPLHNSFSCTTLYNYTLTLPIRESTLAPRSAVLDPRSNLLIHRLGQRIRICGGTELGGKPSAKNKKTMSRMYQVLEQFFPGAAKHDAGGQIFKSSQLFSANGLPRLGASGIPGLWINAGHGVHGWGTACGSAKLIADLIAKKEPDISAQAFQR